MIKKQFTKKVSILCIVFISLFSSIHAQGPNTPEAAAFEPVDATDMVNLVTGDLSYVLPLLNIPSPEGGYPIALSYHAGIAMDQEASWVGLGWSLNPGAINRSVNGNPDDWSRALIREFAYDEGGSEFSSSVSFGVGLPGKFSIGVGVSWGSNQSLGGSVSLNLAGTYGSIGTNGVSGGFGINKGLGVGASIGYNGSIGISTNFGVGDGASLSLGIGSGPGGFNGSLGISVSQAEIKDQRTGGIMQKASSASIGIDFSSSGVGLSGKANGIGTSASIGFSNQINSSDYDIKNKSSQFMLITPFGFFSFGKNETSWKLNQIEYNTVHGSMYLYEDYPYYTEGVANNTNIYDKTYDVYEISTLPKFEQSVENRYTYNNNNSFTNFDNYNVSGQGIGGSIRPFLVNNLFLRSYNIEVFIRESRDNLYITHLNDESNLSISKPVTFNFDTFTNSYLNVLPHDIYYDSSTDKVLSSPPSVTNSPGNLSLSNDQKLVYLNNTFNETKHKIRKGKYVEYFTIEDINSGIAATKGFLSEGNNYNLTPEACGFTYDFSGGYLENFNKSIGAFKITMQDGKTYHYSLPVYQMEQVRRLYGIIEDKSEDQANMDRIQSNPYATHWLLTAITGPDYIKSDPNRNYPDEGDFGYWVRFDYGQWSEGYIWKTPNGNEYSEDVDIFGKVKEYSWGRKQLYYLDKIKTRTHSAVFVKKLRQDLKSQKMVYKNMTHHIVPALENKYVDVNWEPTLALDKIMLFKNSDANLINKSNGVGLETITNTINYTLNGRYDSNGVWRADLYSEVSFKVNKHNEVFDISDISSSDKQNVIKTINFGYNPNQHKRDLVTNENTAPSGSHDLMRINYKGKNDFAYIPSTEFKYNSKYINQKGDFGYHKYYPEQNSLKEITTSIGAKINIDYEPDEYSKVAIKNGKVFTNQLKFSFLTNPTFSSDTNFLTMNEAPKSNIQIKIEVDTEDTVFKLSNYFDPNKVFFMDMWYSVIDNYDGGQGSGYHRATINIDKQEAEILELNEIDNFMVVEVEASSPAFHGFFNHNIEPVSVLHAMNDFQNSENKNLPRFEIISAADGEKEYSLRHTLIGNKIPSNEDQDKSSGIRVKRISVDNFTGGVNFTEYIYNNPNTDISSGILPYYPEPNYSVEQQAPFISLLPGPVVTYEYVKEVSGSESMIEVSKIYKFKTLREIDNSINGTISFGDLLKIECIEENPTDDVNLKYVTVKNELSSLGRLEEFTLLNSKNQKISHTENEYSTVSEEHSLGQFKQSYFSKKNVRDYKYDIYKKYGSVSRKIDKFSTLKRTKTIDGNISFTEYFDKHDFLTGQVLETSTFASDGTAFKTKTVPAYTKYSTMGSKVDDINNKNMLTQSAANYSYLLDESGNEKVVSANITTWNDNWSYRDHTGNQPASSTEASVWRKHKSFIWKGDLDTDGTYVGFNQSNDDGFNWGVGASQTNSKWQTASETTRYDHYSAPLESKDINGNYAASKMADDNSKVIATSNAAYVDMYYSGAEYLSPDSNAYFDGEVKAFGQKESETAHTGNYVVEISNGQKAFEVNIPENLSRNTPRKQRFKVSVWVRSNQAGNVQFNFNGTPSNFNPAETIVAGDWTLLNGYVDIPPSGGNFFIKSTATVQLDDFRLHPIVSSMSSYVYNEWDEVSYITGTNGLSTHYVYDDAGRLKETWVEVQTNNAAGITGGFKKVKENNYNYGN